MKNLRNLKTRVLSLFLTLALVIGMFPTTARAGQTETEENATNSVTVYFSMSEDDGFMKVEKTGAVMALKEVTVPYFDLENYGLEDFYFASEDYNSGSQGGGTKESAAGHVTMLHLFIYATEVYYYGINPSEAGLGYLKEQDIIGTEVFDISGSSGSTFFNNIWSYDCNLNYYLNYEYPLASGGWGATSDQILLEDGDIVTLGHFSDWSFWSDSGAGFNYAKVGESTGVVKVVEGTESVAIDFYHAGASMMGDYSTAHTQISGEPEVYYINAGDLSSGNLSDWEYLGCADENGQYIMDTSELDCGEYIICMPGQYGTDYTDAICSAPGGIRLIVEKDADKEAAEAVITKISAIGTVSLEREKAITEARAAYDALSAKQAELVSNYVDLTAAESALAQLKKEKAEKDEKEKNQKVADAVIAKIAAIGTVTVESKEAITLARASYDVLTEAQKALVTNYNVLTAAEATYAKLVEAAKAEESNTGEGSSTGEGSNTGEEANTEEGSNTGEEANTEEGSNTGEEANTEEEVNNEVKVGDKFTVDKNIYKITKASGKNRTVEFVKPKKKTEKKVTVPATVKIKGVSYKVTSIGSKAFQKNTKLTSVSIGKNVTSIGSYAFDKCSKLKSVTLPANVTKIGAYAFRDCKKLKTITINSKKISSKTINKKAFKGLTKYTTIKVPSSKKKSYTTLFRKCGLSKKVKVKAK